MSALPLPSSALAWTAVAASPANAQVIRQSALLPGSLEATDVVRLSWILFGGGTLVFLVVAVIVFIAVGKRARLPSTRTLRILLLGGGVAFPATVCVALVAYAMVVSARMNSHDTADALRVEIVGEMWWWRVHYLDATGRRVATTANELHVPAGRPVAIALRSADVIHSLWLPGLSGMLDLIPGRTNTLRFTATTPGDLRGQCTEFCGAQHAKMGIDVRVHDEVDFDAWLAHQQGDARPPDTPSTRRGAALFEASCSSCHAIRGTTAAGTLGPDLTHIGSRRSLAASALPNNRGTLAAWIVGSQHLKPGNRMPSFESFPGDDLNALADYLASLR